LENPKIKKKLKKSKIFEDLNLQKSEKSRKNPKKSLDLENPKI
jgi:hypothetical protein